MTSRNTVIAKRLLKLAKDLINDTSITVDVDPSNMGGYVMGDQLTDKERSLLKYGPVDARMDVAEDEESSPALLKELAKDADAKVRRCVSANEKTPADALAGLASDGDESVRMNVACNKNTPEETLAKLVKDQSELVRHNIAMNDNVTAMILDELLRNYSNDEDLLWIISLSEKASNAMLSRCAQNGNHGTKINVINNKNTPFSVIDMLVMDKDPDVSEKAEKRWNEMVKKSPLLVSISRWKNQRPSRHS